MDNSEMCYRRFLGGDKSGFEDIVLLYREGLTIYINSIVRNIDTAEELTEDTFAKLFVDKPRFNGKSTFKTWLYSIGRHTAIDYIRHAAKISEVSYENYGDLPSNSSVERSYIKKEDQLELHRAMQSLKSDYRQILYLVYFEDFNNSEAAMIMKKSDKQIRDLLYNAKKSLKTELERRGFEYEGF